MATLIIDYDSLSAVSTNANKLAKKADDYANELTKRVAKRFADIEGGSSAYTSDANYYVNEKVSELQNKAIRYENLASDVNNFTETAKRVDEEVETMIKNNQETFLKGHENLRIDNWKASLLNWLVDLKNSCPLFELIGDIARAIESELSSLLDALKYWYKCEGGKEVVALVLAIAGAIVAVLLFVAAFPASGFFAICAAIGATITLINATINIATSAIALINARNGDPAWARIYGKMDKFSDVLRFVNLGDGELNRMTYTLATTLDVTELFCDAVGIVKAIGDLKSKFAFINNFFGKNTGLLAYCKEAKWIDTLQYDELGNISGVTKTIATNQYGIVLTRFTPRSIWRGLKAFVMDSPIDCRSGDGIRRILTRNLATDFSDFRHSFSFAAIKDTLRYNRTHKSALDTLLFSKDPSMVAQAKNALSGNKLLKAYAESIKGGALRVEDMFTKLEGDSEKVMMRKIYTFDKITEFSNKVGVTKVLGEKFGWKHTSDGLIQRSVTQWDKGKYIVYGLD